MNELEYINNPDVQCFIQEHRGMPLPELVLKLHGKKYLPSEFIVSQVNALQKIKGKLPDWEEVHGLVFPSKVSFEQCSSSETGLYKSMIIDEFNSAVDLTGGFGVDTYYFALRCGRMLYVERDSALCEIVRYNSGLLNVAHIEVFNKDCEVWLKEHFDIKLDLVYLDPARRGENNQKLYKVEDCEPNVLKLLPSIFNISSRLLVKFSPMIDLSLLLHSLKFIKEVHIVSVKNECKEVLVYWEHGYLSPTKIIAVDIKRGMVNSFTFNLTNNSKENIVYAEPMSYLYEPNASLMKAQAFGALSEHYKIAKLSPNSHLYTSHELIASFPGRIFRVVGVSEYSEKALKSNFSITKANVTVRNFGETVEQVKKKLKIKDGGSVYIYATSTVSQKRLLVICEPIS